MEDVLIGIAGLIGGIIGIYILFYPIRLLIGWLQKTTGVKVKLQSGPFGPSIDELESSSQYEHRKNLEELSKMDSKIVEEATNNIRNSMYDFNSTNVLQEAKKLWNIKTGNRTQDKVKDFFQRSLNKSDNMNMRDINKLERLHDLLEIGALSSTEYEAQKEKILSKYSK